MKTSGQPKSLARAVGGITLTRIITNPLNIIVSILVTRALGPELKGMWAYLLLISGTVLPIAMLGLPIASRYYILTEKYDTRTVAFTEMLAGLFIGVLVGVGAFFLYMNDMLGPVAASIPMVYFAAVCLLLPFIAGYIMLDRGALLAEGQFAYSNTVTIAGQLVLIFSLIVLVLVFGQQLDGVVISKILMSIFVFVGVAYKTFQIARPQLRFDSRFLKDITVYGAKLGTGSIGNQANSRFDQVVISMFLSADQLGIYAAAVAMSNLIVMPSGGMLKVLFNKAAAYKDDDEARGAFIAKLHRVSLFLFGLFGVVVLAAGYFAVPILYGKEFAGAAVPLLIYGPGLVINLSTRIVHRFFITSGRPMMPFYVKVGSFLIALPFYFILIPKWGLVGAALVSTLGYSCAGIISVIVFMKITGRSLSSLLVPSSGDWRWTRKQIQMMPQPLTLRLRRLFQKQSQ